MICLSVVSLKRASSIADLQRFIMPTKLHQRLGFIHICLHIAGIQPDGLIQCPRPESRQAMSKERRPVPQMAKRLFGKLIGDKGYRSNALVA